MSYFEDLINSTLNKKKELSTFDTLVNEQLNPSTDVVSVGLLNKPELPKPKQTQFIPQSYYLGEGILGGETISALKLGTIKASELSSKELANIRIKEMAEQQKKSTKTIQEFGKTTGQSIARSFVATGAALYNGLEESYTPQNDIEKKIFGTDKPINFKTIGEETLMIGGEDFKNKWGKYSVPVGMLIAGLDVTPLGGGKASVAKQIAKTDDVVKITKLLKGVVKGSDEEIGILAKSLKSVTKEDEVLKILDTAGTSKVASIIAPQAQKATQKAITAEKGIIPQELQPLAQAVKGVSPTPLPKGAMAATEGKVAQEVGGGVGFNAEKYVQEQVVKSEVARKIETPGIVQNVKNFNKEVKKKLVDFASPIEDVLGKAEKAGAKIPETEHITNQIDRVLRSPTIAGQFARDNGLEAVIKQVDNLDNLDQYLIAKQAKTVASRGIETGRNLVKDEQLIKEFAPRYEKAAKVVNDYSKKLLDYSVDSGLISKELADTLKLRYPDYVPINRIFNEAEKAGGFGSKAIASLSKQTVVQKLAGSERQIESPIKSLLEKTADAFKQGEKNKAGRMLAGYEKLPGNPFQLRELKPGESVPFTISYLDNGVKRTFETTQDIVNAAKSLNVQQLNILGKIFALPVRLAKLGITGINLPFVASNIAKDQITAIINSKNALRTLIANPAVFLKSLFEAVGHGKVYEEMAREGALGTSFDIARNQVTQNIARIRAGRNFGSRIKYIVRNPGELLRSVENIVGRSEEFTRIQQYAGTKQALLKKGLSEKEAVIGAARAARENTVNFARRGEWGQVLNSAFLYLNASIQGTRTFLRNLTQRPIQTATKIALTVFAPIAAATAWNLSDPKRKEAYDDIAEYEKQNNIIIIPPNPTKNEDGTWNVIKIPLSQEINNLAGMARRPIEQAFGLNPVSVQDIASALIGSVSPIAPTTGSFASTLTPQAIKPSIESLTNRNLFTGYPIVPQSMEKLSPELQAKPYTSGTARKVGEMTDLSPLKIEAFIKGTLGGVGAQVLNVSDRILAGLDIIPKDQIGGQDTIKAIIARFSLARGGQADEKSNKILEDLITSQADESFRLKQEAEIIYADLKKLSKDEANAKANQIKEVNPQLYDKLKSVVESEKLGLDYNDRLMMQLQVTNGERAKFIWENLKTLKTNEEKNAYVEELRTKKIISDNVMEQLRQLKSKGL